MLSAILVSNFSIWGLIICLLIGALYSFILYQKSIRTKLNYLLYFLRGFLVSFLCFLLLSPIVEHQQKELKKPVIFFAQDNSASIAIKGANDDSVSYKKSIDKLIADLSETYNVKVLEFGDKIKEGLSFDYKDQQTDISEVFNYLNAQYYDDNIGAVILASDGIINKGFSPVNEVEKLKYPIYTLALGDTIAKRDLIIANVNANKIVYLGNDYELLVSLEAYQSLGNKVRLSVETEDGQKKSQEININNNDWKANSKVILSAKRKGVQKIVISIAPIENEISLQNNTQTIYVEVIDGREKVLILANAPHPDISALKQSIESNENYKVDVFLADQAPINFVGYGLIIFHNLPSVNSPIKEVFNKAEGKSKWFITGSQVNIGNFNQYQSNWKFTEIGANNDLFPVLNSDFHSFSLSKNIISLIDSSAPLNGVQYRITGLGAVQNLLLVKSSNDILLGFSDQNGENSAVLAGEGLWRWRLDDYSKNGNHDLFNELITKTVQYLTVKEDKRKFRAYPTKTRFNTNEQVVFNAEVYDDSFSPVNDADVSLDITNKKGKKLSYVFSRRDKFYELNAGFLSEGEYTFKAMCNFAGKKEEVNGQFLIEKINSEYLNTKANHQLLYNLSTISGGKLFYKNELEKLKKEIQNSEKIKTVSYFESKYDDLVNLKWVFFVLMLCLSLEWFLRKRNGMV